MEARKHYSHAPITEAVINIQAQLSPKVKLDVLWQMYSNIQTEYPKCEDVFILQGQMIVAATVESTATQSQIGYRVLS
ncbi:MAG: TIGR04255 family protein, partial [bacterium]